MTMSGTLRSDVAELGPEMTELRHQLHRAPEIGLQLPRTQETLLEVLWDAGLEITLGQSVTSITGVLRGGRSTGTAVLLRADMDALPVQERSGEPFTLRRSTARCTPAATTCTRRCSSVPPGCSPRSATSCPATSSSCSSPAKRAATAPAP